MKKVILFAGIAAMLMSCEKSEPIPEIFTFTVNGKEMDFSDNIKVEKNILNDEIQITGKKTNVGKVILTIHDNSVGNFDESDYNANFDDFSVNYLMSYSVDDENNFYYLSSSTENWFKIGVQKFDNVAAGEVSGTFSCFLKASILNSNDTLEDVLIENGKFSTKLDNRIN